MWRTLYIRRRDWHIYKRAIYTHSETRAIHIPVSTHTRTHTHTCIPLLLICERVLDHHKRVLCIRIRAFSWLRNLQESLLLAHTYDVLFSVHLCDNPPPPRKSSGSFMGSKREITLWSSMNGLIAILVVDVLVQFNFSMNEQPYQYCFSRWL